MFRFKTLSSSGLSYDYESDYGTPDYTITSFPSTDTSPSSSDDLIVAIDANISSTDDGVLIEMGGNGGHGFAVGVNNGTLRARAFDAISFDTWDNNNNAAFVEVDISSYTGSDATYYIVVDADSSSRTLTVYVQPGGKGSTNTLVQLGTDTSGLFYSAVYGTDGKGYGQVNSTIANLGAAYEVNFNGTIDEIRYWSEDGTLDASGFGS